MTPQSIEQIVADIRLRVKKTSRIVFISGKFNIIHPGHLRIINFAATCGDFLVIGVNADGMSDAHLPENLRLESIKSIGVVDYAFILRYPPEEFIAQLQPTTVVKGREHSSHHNLELAAVESYGGKLLFASGDVRFSSLDLLRKEIHEANFSSIQLPKDYPARHGFNKDDLMGVIKKFADLHVVVVGDLIVDEYIDCDALGMSREDPTLVVMPIISEKFVGGAGITSAHAKGIGATVSYFAVAAEDETSRFAKEKLEGYGVSCHLLYDDTRPTTLKQRYRANKKTLLRVSHLRQHDISDDLVHQMFESMQPALDKADLLLFSDFNYGCLPQSLVNKITQYCILRQIPMAADSQASSQIGDVSRFKGMQLLTPTEHEARLAVRDFQSGLIGLADELRKRASAEYIILTLAGEGMIIHWPDEAQARITDRLPAFNTSPKDVSGAGDCLFTCTSMALTVGADIWLSAYLGSIAAACQVSRLGNTPLTVEELIQEISL